MGGKTRHKGNLKGNPAAHGVRERTSYRKGEATPKGICSGFTPSKTNCRLHG
ncbi:hypothetical protein DPMN_123373 [Dreissena polymorpha]|uniref:Ribosomal protein L2 n=1 Tax=Dreissena polymorpha TaxID=45954 RepID=A0A9D4GTL9_DREPO|nr:hypothetical protein DPMN_123373 [Dreissena polymorpha]